ncbi:hypothetical protein PLAN_100199 [Planktothrix rubescens CCAP 1459/22]|uniref:Uncharacterized protein n=1 Tax=Planktothrix rubescens CCAP 1459/22 TaxID=329571 RepID=A0A6J7ZFJ7_PLARU|nr:hypothetical protein PLAN_100199 [Planktothrix rubescens NIVA-CYA 18]CAD0228993.1 conserved hypothetical protein [Planktothrix agardhii]
MLRFIAEVLLKWEESPEGLTTIAEVLLKWEESPEGLTTG